MIFLLTQLDAATESILNVVYYAILITIVLAAVGKVLKVNNGIFSSLQSAYLFSM